MPRIRIFLALALAALTGALPVRAGTQDDETAIRALLDEWYVQKRAAHGGNFYRLLAPGAIDASPGFYYVDTGARAIKGPPIHNSRAATALKFSHEITRLVRDARFARVQVWERGYFYAWAAQQTYERAESTTFVLEKQDDGRWLVLAHQMSSVGIPPNMKTDPCPISAISTTRPMAKAAIRRRTRATRESET
jgi:hypothetical protein